METPGRGHGGGNMPLGGAKRGGARGRRKCGLQRRRGVGGLVPRVKGGRPLKNQHLWVKACGHVAPKWGQALRCLSVCTVTIRLGCNIKPTAVKTREAVSPFILEAGSRACVTAPGSSALHGLCLQGSPPVPNTELSLEPLLRKAAAEAWLM